MQREHKSRFTFGGNSFSLEGLQSGLTLYLWLVFLQSLTKDRGAFLSKDAASCFVDNIICLSFVYFSLLFNNRVITRKRGGRNIYRGVKWRASYQISSETVIIICIMHFLFVWSFLLHVKPAPNAWCYLPFVWIFQFQLHSEAAPSVWWYLVPSLVPFVWNFLLLQCLHAVLEVAPCSIEPT